MKEAEASPASHVSDGVIVIVEVDVSGSLPVTAHELFVAGGPLVLGIAGQHALDAHADTLNVLHWTPSLLAEKIQADDAVGVDVGVHRDWTVGQLHKHDFGRLWGGGC